MMGGKRPARDRAAGRLLGRWGVMYQCDGEWWGVMGRFRSSHMSGLLSWLVLSCSPSRKSCNFYELLLALSLLHKLFSKLFRNRSSINLYSRQRFYARNCVIPKFLGFNKNPGQWTLQKFLQSAFALKISVLFIFSAFPNLRREEQISNEVTAFPASHWTEFWAVCCESQSEWAELKITS